MADDTPEMVERVEQAILRAIGEQFGCNWDRCTCFGAAEVLECKLNVTAHDLALVAVEAMREPIDAMCDAAWDAGGVGDNGGHERGSFEEEYQAAMDAALGVAHEVAPPPAQPGPLRRMLGG